MNMRNRPRIAAVLMVFAFLGSAGAIVAAEPSVRELPLWPTDVSADGSVVVGTVMELGSVATNAARWTAAGGAVRLDFKDENFTTPSGIGGYSDSTAAAVSADGRVVVGNRALRWECGGDAGPVEYVCTTVFGYRWSEGTTGYYGTVPYGARLNGISADGRVAVGVDGTTGWSVGVRRADHPTDVRSSYANAVSADGGVVVGGMEHQSGLTEAFRWSDQGGMVGLGGLPARPNSRADAISADGVVVVGSAWEAIGPRHAFRWTETGGMADLGTLPGYLNFLASDASADGSVVVGGAFDADDRAAAFVWDPVNGMRSLGDVLAAAGVDTTGYNLGFAMAISADGTTIVGVGYDASGGQFSQGWLVTVPEPAVISLLAVVGVLFGRWPRQWTICS